MLTNATRLLTVDEVADRLRLNRASIYRYIRHDGLPHMRLGGELGPIRVREDDLEVWLQQCHNGPEVAA
jgi:excisionase family DNA binding protein